VNRRMNIKSLKSLRAKVKSFGYMNKNVSNGMKFTTNVLKLQKLRKSYKESERG